MMGERASPALCGFWLQGKTERTAFVLRSAGEKCVFQHRSSEKKRAGKGRGTGSNRRLALETGGTRRPQSCEVSKQVLQEVEAIEIKGTETSPQEGEKRRKPAVNMPNGTSTPHPKRQRHKKPIGSEESEGWGEGIN